MDICIIYLCTAVYVADENKMTSPIVPDVCVHWEVAMRVPRNEIGRFLGYRKYGWGLREASSIGLCQPRDEVFPE